MAYAARGACYQSDFASQRKSVISIFGHSSARFKICTAVRVLPAVQSDIHGVLQHRAECRRAGDDAMAVPEACLRQELVGPATRFFNKQRCGGRTTCMNVPLATRS